MLRVLIGGAVLLLFGGATAHRKQELPVFVFLGINQKQNVAMLRPMVAPDIGVQFDSGAGDIKPGTILRCKTSEREYPAIVDGQLAKVTDLVLDCGESKFVVKGIDFSPGAR